MILIKKYLAILVLCIIVDFTFAQPTISSFSPTSGPVGTNVAITGTNFSNTVSGNSVFFGGVKANVLSATNSSLIVNVPYGSSYKPISVTTNGLTGVSSKFFITTFPCGNVINSNSLDASLIIDDLTSFSVANGDIDGDGKPDIVIGYFNDTVSIFKNTSTNSNISFSQKVKIPLNLIPDFAFGVVALNDIDGDGKLDIIVMNYRNSITVLRNTGTPGTISFAPPITISLGQGTGLWSLAVADFDLDGKPDIVVSNRDSNFITFLRNTSSIGTVSFANTIINIGPFSNPNSLAVGDIDGDGKPDIAIASSGTSSISIIRNTSSVGNISFDGNNNFNVGAQPLKVIMGDLDGDGKLDIITLVNNVTNLSVLKNTSSGTGSISYAARVNFATVTNPQDIEISDLDGDGKPDLAVTNSLAGINDSFAVVSLYKNTSTTGNVSFAAKTDFTTGSQTNKVSIGDIDGDGLPDVILAGQNDPNWKLTVKRNKISNIVTPLVNISTASRTTCKDSSVSFLAVISNGGTSPSYKWKVNGIIAGTNSAAFTSNTLKNGDSIQVEMTSNAACAISNIATSAILTVTVINSLQPSVIVTASATTICAGTNVTFTAIPTNEGPSPIYQWKLNGINVGTNNTLYTNSTLSNGDVVSCSITNNIGCSKTASSAGVSISVKILPAVEPIVMNLVNTKGSICIGPSVATLSDNTPGGTWSSSDLGKATISTIGQVVTLNAIAIGNVTITYSVTNSNGCIGEASKMIAVVIPIGPINPITGITTIASGATSVLSNTTIGTNGTWSTDDVSRATISSSGVLSGVSAGSTNVTYSIATLNGCVASVTTPVTIISNSNLQCPTVSLINKGGTCTPTFTISGTANAEKITWYNGNSVVNTVNAVNATSGVTVSGLNGQGASSNQLDNPTGVFVDGNGNVYIADQANKRIQKWAPGANSAITVAGGNGSGTGANQLFDPTGIYVDVVGNVYVADGAGNRIQKWAPGATSGTTVAGGNGFLQSSGPNQLNGPTGVFVDGSGNIYIADQGNNRIQKWTVGAITGTTVAGGNGNGSAANQLANPSGVYVDASGNIYVADKNNHRIQKWAAGAITGTTVAGGNDFGSAADKLYFPFGVFVDCYSNVFVADATNNRIQKWSLGAAAGITIAGGNTGVGPYTGANQLNNPSGVYIDGNGAIYIADQYNHRIQKWLPTINSNYTPGSSGTYSAVVNFGGTINVTSNTFVTTIIGAPPTISTSGPTGFCLGSNVILSSSANSGNQWLKNGVPITGEINSKYSASASGTYTVSLSTSSGCILAGTSSGTVVTVNPLPTVSIITGNQSACVGSTITLSNATLNGTWSSSNTSVATVSSLGVVTGISSGTVTVTYTVTNNSGCSASESKIITVNSLPIVLPISGNPVFCVGATSTLSNATSGGQWSSNNQNIAMVNNNGGVTGVASGPTTISYSITNTTGCTATAAMGITINNKPPDAAVTVLGPTTVCSGTGITLTSNSATNNQWMKDGLPIIGEISQNYIATMGGSYAVKVAAASACAISGTSSSTLITVNPLPVVTIISGNVSLCVGSSIQLSNDTPNGIWGSSEIAKATVSAIGLVTGISAGTVTITYIVTNNNGCSSLQSKVLTIYALPAVSSISGNTGVCVGVAAKLFDATPGGSWSSNNTAVAVVSDQGVVTGILNGGSIIKYEVTSISGCVASSSFTITVNGELIQPVLNTNLPFDTRVVNATGSNFSVATTAGTAPFIFQWQVSTNGGAGWNDITITGTSPSYTDWTTKTISLSGTVPANDGYQYRCVVSNTNACGAFSVTSNAASLSVSRECFAPDISQNPESSSIKENRNSFFSIIASNGVAPFLYQWQQSTDGGNTWANITSAGLSPIYSNWTTQTLNVSGVKIENDSYQYRCIVTSSNPCSTTSATSNPGILYVSSDCSPPEIAMQPVNSRVTTSSNTSFLVSAESGSLPCSYQWQVSINGGSSWNNIQAAGSFPSYSNWTTETLSLAGVISSNDTYQYRCIVSAVAACNAFSVISNVATLTVSQNCIEPTMILNPVNSNITEGSSTFFKASANGGTTPYTYQWQVSTNSGNAWSNISASGSFPVYSNWTTETLNLISTSVNNNNYQYRCIITSSKPCASSAVTSKVATLTVNASCVPPSISNQPANSTVVAASKAGFTVSVDGGTTPYGYQWQVSTTGGNSWSNITAAGNSPIYANWTSASLSLSNTAISHNGYLYRCIISSATSCNTSKVISNQASLAVSSGCNQPNFLLQPANASVTALSNTSFTISVNGGTVPYIYQWQISTNGGGSWTSITTSGSNPIYANWTTPTLSLAGVSAANNNYRYRCLVTSGTPCGTSSNISNAATLFVATTCQMPAIASPPVSVSVTEGSDASFSISASGGNRPYTYQWQVSTNGGNTWSPISSPGSTPTYANWTTATLSLAACILTNDNYRYKCVVSSANPCNNSSITSVQAILNVKNNKQKYVVSASASPASGGAVTGAGTFDAGTSVTLNATSNAGWKFVNWTENGTSVSTNINYTFTVTSARTFSANFSADVPPYLEIGGLLVYAKNIPPTGATRTLSGNVYIIPKNNCSGTGGLHLPDNVMVNTSLNTVVGTGMVYCDNIGSLGRVSIFNGTFILHAVGDLLYASTFDVNNVLFKLAGLKLSIADMQILCDGIRIDGKLEMPTIFSAYASSGTINAQINSLYLTRAGIDLSGEIALKDLKIESAIPIDYLSLDFDTKANDFLGKAGLRFPAFKVNGEVGFKSGKLDKIGLGYSSNSAAIPVFGTGMSITSINGSLQNINTPPRSLQFNATIVPTELTTIPSLTDISIQANYSFGESFNASGTFNVFKNAVAKTGFTVSKGLFQLSGDISLLGVLDGHSLLSISSSNGQQAKLRGNFNANLHTPKFSGILYFLNSYIPSKTIASTNNYLSNQYLAGVASTGVKLWPKLYYSLNWYDPAFNFGTNVSSANIPAEAQAQLPFGRIRPTIDIKEIKKIASFGPKPVGSNTKRKAFSFDLNSYTNNLIITGISASSAPALSLYVNKKDTITPSNYGQYKNVIYSIDTVSKTTYILINNPALGSYFVWSNDIDSIQINKVTEPPTVEIIKMVNDSVAKEITVDFNALNADNYTQLSFGLDDDRNNTNGILLADSITPNKTTGKVVLKYGNIKSGIFYLYASIVDSMGHNNFTYHNTPIKIITDSAPSAPRDLIIQQAPGSFFVSFNKNNTQPLIYLLHYSVSPQSVNFNSAYLTLSDTNFAEITTLPPGKNYEFAITAMDTSGRESDLSNIVFQNIMSSVKNNYPSFEINKNSLKTKSNRLYTAILKANDPDGDPLIYSLIQAPATAQINNVGTLEWTPQSQDLGYRQFYVKVEDGKGGSDSLHFEVLTFDSGNSVPDISFNKPGYDQYSDSARIQLTDPLIIETDSIQTLTAHIYSTSDKKGLLNDAMQTNGPVSEFYSRIYFTKGSSSGRSLKVSKGDTVWVEYKSAFSQNTVVNYSLFNYIKSDMVFQDSLCNTDLIHFFNASKGALLNYHWSFGDGTESFIKNPDHQYPFNYGYGSSIYNVQLIVTNTNGTSDTASRSITIYKTPNKAIATSGPTSFCFGDSVILNAPLAELYLWSTGSTANTLTIKRSGVYTMINSNGNVCFSTDTIAVQVYPLPLVNAGSDATIKLGSGILLGGTPTSTGNAPFRYKWTPSIGLSNDSIANPFALPYKPTIYKVLVTDNNGCFLIDNVFIKVTPVIMEDKVIVYPNPVTNVLNIQFILTADTKTTIYIYNMYGQIVKKVIENKGLQIGYQYYSVPFGDVPAGMYYIHFNNKQITTIIKE